MAGVLYVNVLIDNVLTRVPVARGAGRPPLIVSQVMLEYPATTPSAVDRAYLLFEAPAACVITLLGWRTLTNGTVTTDGADVTATFTKGGTPVTVGTALAARDCVLVTVTDLTGTPDSLYLRIECQPTGG